MYVASPLAGQLESVFVQRGDHVNAGDPLFALENTSEKASVRRSGTEALTRPSEPGGREKGQTPHGD